MKVLITGSCGLIGSETVRFYGDQGCQVTGIDNDMRKYFFGEKGTTAPIRHELETQYKKYQHHAVDIRNREAVFTLIRQVQPDLIVHTAAQPSHDWAAREPFTDYEINSTGTLNLLEGTHQHAPRAVFIFLSTNKVYGDRPNHLGLDELKTRYEYQGALRGQGIDETLSIDQSLHSLFGASKLSADILCQEYGKYFGMNVAIFRGGCLTGGHHAGVELHGFLSYLIHCALNKKPYTIIGYKGKQVRDQIHSKDVVQAIECFREKPRPGEVYNLGGGYQNSASILELVDLLKKQSLPIETSYRDGSRIGDHICYYTDMKKFQTHYPKFKLQMTLPLILEEMIEYASDDAQKAA